jgi:hypothetical protein
LGGITCSVPRSVFFRVYSIHLNANVRGSRRF